MKMILNMAYGFLAGLAAHYSMRRVIRDSSGHDQAIHGCGKAKR